MSARTRTADPDSLATRIAALAELDGIADPDPERTGVIERARARRERSAEHTVVGLFGATGSGKSSLLNALVGSAVATAHVRRPTTSEPLAVVWDVDGSAELLDWLEVHQRVASDRVIDPRAERLILLDLPDFDSVAADHRAIAQRLAGQVDVLVWVLDPEKYADDVVHHDFIAPHARHGAVTIVVLNQVDRVADADVPRVLEHVLELVQADGVSGAQVMGTSALTGAGVDRLRRAIGDIAGNRAAVTQRLVADIATCADRVPPAFPGGVPSDARLPDTRALAAELATAAGAESVAEAVAGSYRKRSAQRGSWPLLAWIHRFRPDPLRRMGLAVTPEEADGRNPALHRSSRPTSTAAESARIGIAVRAWTEEAALPLSEPWRGRIRESTMESVAQLPDRLDRAIVAARLPTGGSRWWGFIGFLQWIALVAALAGVAWLLLVAFAGPFAAMFWLSPVPEVEGWSIPTLLIGGGLLLGAVITLSRAGIASLVARRRRTRALGVLRAAAGEVARDTVVGPTQTVLAAARAHDEARALALGPSR